MYVFCVSVKFWSSLNKLLCIKGDLLEKFGIILLFCLQIDGGIVVCIIA